MAPVKLEISLEEDIEFRIAIKKICMVSFHGCFEKSVKELEYRISLSDAHSRSMRARSAYEFPNEFPGHDSVESLLTAACSGCRVLWLRRTVVTGSCGYRVLWMGVLRL